MPLPSLRTHDRPLVSIVTPTFNHENFIGACIESVLRQTYENWELIIVDDGSTDRTRFVIQNYPDPRIHYIHQKHQGIEALPHTYNRALECANGSLIAILEGDDVWPSNKLDTQIPGFEDDEVIVAYGMVGELSADGKWGGQLSRSARRNRNLPAPILSNSPVGSTTLSLLSRSDLIPPSAAIIRRSALEAIGGFQYVPGLCVTDFPTFLRLSREGKFHYTPEIMGFRRRHLQSVSFNNIERISTAAYRHTLEFIQRHNLNLKAAERRRMDENWRRGKFSHAFVEGRSKLIHRDWKDARRSFRKAVHIAEPLVSLASIFGWSLSWLRCDLEWVFRMEGRAVIKEQPHPTLPMSLDSRARDARTFVARVQPDEHKIIAPLSCH